MLRFAPVVLVLLLTGCSGDQDRPAASTSASPQQLPSVPVSSGAPAGWLASLTDGKPTSLAYRIGATLYFGGRATTLPSADVDLVGGYRSLLVRERHGGRITAYRSRRGLVAQVARRSGGLPVFFSPFGDGVLVPRAGSPVVDLVDLRVGNPRGPRIEDSQAFPVPCCKDFRIVGTTQFAEVLVDTAEGPWVWSASEGQEGVPYLVPDSDEFIEPFPAPYDATPLYADTGDTFFFADAHTYYSVGSPEGEGRFPRGVRRFDHFHEAEFSGAVQYALVRRRNGALDAVDLQSYVTRRLPVPLSVDARFVRWDDEQDDSSVLLDVTDETGARAVVRCNAVRTTCERAQDLPTDAVLADYRP